MGKKTKEEKKAIAEAKRQKNSERAKRAWVTIRKNKAEAEKKATKKTPIVAVCVKTDKTVVNKIDKIEKEIEILKAKKLELEKQLLGADEKKLKNRARALKAWETIRKNKAEAEKTAKKKVRK